MRHVALRLELCHLTPEPVDLQLLGLHLTVSGKRLLRIRAKFLHPFTNNVLVDVDVPGRLSRAYASLTHQADRLDLELSTELAPLHRLPPAPRNTYAAVLEDAEDCDLAGCAAPAFAFAASAKIAFIHLGIDRLNRQTRQA